MIKLNSLNHDKLVEVSLFDNSVMQPTPPATPVGFSYLQPFFSRKGIDNTITRYTSLGVFSETYGKDLTDVVKYGHGGLVAAHGLEGGAVIDACRLMDKNAVQASVILSVCVQEDNASKPYLTKRVVKHVLETYDFSKSVKANFKTKTIKTTYTETDVAGVTTTKVANFKKYPILSYTAKGRGSYGNDIGFEIFLNPDRDAKKTLDGRRYTLRFSEGNFKLGNPFEDASGSFNSTAVALPGSSIADGLVDVFSAYATENNLPIDANFSYENYIELITDLDKTLNVKSPSGESLPNMIDFITGFDYKTGEKYATDEAGTKGYIVIDNTWNPKGTGASGANDDITLYPTSVNYDADGVALETPVTNMPKFCTAGFGPKNIHQLIGGTDGNTFSKAPAYYQVKPKYVPKAGSSNEYILEGDKVPTSVMVTDAKFDNAKIEGISNLSTSTTPTLATAMAQEINNIAIKSGDDHYSVGYVTRRDLLIDFYSGKIDANIYDARIIDAGITFDAWWPKEVKDVMSGVFGTTVRDDIYVVLDCGEDCDGWKLAVGTAKEIASGHPYGSVSIIAHNGVTKDRARNVRTSGCYEYIYALPRLYNNYGVYTVLAGYRSGKVTTMTFDDFPKVMPNNAEIKQLKEGKLIYAMKLERSNDLYFMSDDSRYNIADNSVLMSERNLIFAGNVIRTFKKILAKYSFHPKDAVAAIPEATRELKEVFSGNDFPSNIPVEFVIGQTRDDKILKSATVNANIYYPDMIEGFKVNITANRQKVTE